MTRTTDRETGARATLADQNRRRTRELEALRERVRRQIADDAEAARRERQRFATDLRREVEDLRRQLRDDQARAAEDLRRQLTAFREQLRRGAEAPDPDGSDPGIPAEAGADARSTARGPATHHPASPRSRSHAEAAGADATAGSDSPDGTTGGEPSDPGATPGSAPAPPADADDLTRIVGIGRGIAQRLAEAGIHTYAALAATGADDLRHHLGELARLAPLESWIEEARRHGSGPTAGETGPPDAAPGGPPGDQASTADDSSETAAREET